MTKTMLVLLLSMTLAACGVPQVRDHDARYPSSLPNEIEVRYSFPEDRGYVSLGALKVKHRKSIALEPTFDGALQKLREAGAQRGAQAVVVIDVNSVGERMIIVSGEAIRWADDR